MLKTYEIVIGIDPDASKSGVGVVFNADKQLSASVMDFPTLCRYLDGMRGLSVLVIVEAGWLVSSNWHLIGRKGVAWAASGAVRGHEPPNGHPHCADGKVIRVGGEGATPVEKDLARQGREDFSRGTAEAHGVHRTDEPRCTGCPPPRLDLQKRKIFC